MRVRHWLALSVLLLAAGLPLQAKVKSKADPQVDFSSYKTYAWVEGLEASRAPVDYIIKSIIDDHMQRRGLQPVEDRANADLWVHYELGIGGQIHVTAADPTYITVGGEPFTYSTIFFNSGSTEGGVMTEGSLAVEIFDHRRHALVWFGSATEGIENRSKREEQLERVIGKMFDGYPVKPAK